VRVNQDHHDNHAHEDLYIAIRDAFNAAERQLKSIDKKHRAPPLSELETEPLLEQNQPQSQLRASSL
jgi:hypothetical protein